MDNAITGQTDIMPRPEAQQQQQRQQPEPGTPVAN